jgi:integrase
MRRSEWSGSVWTIPRSRSKNHRAHDVPLPPLAAEILEDVDTAGDLVFSTNGSTQISGWSKVKIKLDESMLKKAREEAAASGQCADEIEIAPWVLHDIRRTAATGMAGIGIAPHIIEAILNHISGAKAGVAGIYNLAQYTIEKREALERWAAHVASLVADRRVQ